MQLNPSDPAQQAHMLQLSRATLSAAMHERQAAEAQLKGHASQVDRQLGLLPLILQTILSPTADAAARNALAVFFKNTIKNQWNPSFAENLIQEADKEIIRTHIVSSMLVVPPSVQRLLADAIVYIAEVDFPSHWPTIVPTIIETLNHAADANAANTALTIAHSLFCRYRKVEELTKEVRDEIVAINAVFTMPLLNAMNRFSALSRDADVTVASMSCEALTNACEVFYDLIYIDMGDEHVRNLAAFMQVFMAGLGLSDARLLPKAGSDDATPLVTLKTSIVNCMSLFVTKYDEDLASYTEQFLAGIWGILTAPSSQSNAMSHLIISCMELLSAAARGSTMLDDPEKLQMLAQQVIMCNLRIADADEELFHESPDAYIQQDIEGSDFHTRRRAACELIRTLLSAYPQRVGPLFAGEVQGLLEKSTTDWKALDCAIFLVTALALQGNSGNSQRGAKQVLNPMIPFESFLTSQILPELGSPVGPAGHLIIKADVLRFVTTFRSHIRQDLLGGILGCIVHWLGTENDVVHSYAAHALERLLSVDDPRAPPRISSDAFFPLSGSVLATLCGRLAKEMVPNPYTMQCLMRVVKSKPDCVASYVGDIVVSMKAVLHQSSKNPSNPLFNHCLFEVISSLITIAPEHAGAIEATLWDDMALVISQEVLEFFPYVFQIMAQLLDTQPAGTALPQPYLELATVLVVPAMYEHKGNIPAVIRLLTAMIRRDAASLHQRQLTEKILGVFRTLIKIKQYDHEGMNVLTSVVLHYPYALVEPYMITIFNDLMTRLTTAKTAKFVRIFIILLSVLVVKNGPDSVIDKFNAVQPNLFSMVFEKVWLAEMQKVVGLLERKVCVVALASLLCDSRQLQAQQAVWVGGVVACLKMIHCAVEHDDVKSFVPRVGSLEELKGAADLVGSDQGFSNLFCPLSGAVAKPEDPCADVKEPNQFFRNRLHGLVADASGQHFVTVLQAQLAPELLALIQ